MDTLLEVDGLKKSFGGVAALSDGRLLLRAGSVHAPCGGNGAGKSTFPKFLTGSTSVTAASSGAGARKSTTPVLPRHWPLK